MKTLAIISPDVARLGKEKTDLIVQTLMTFDDYYSRLEPLVTDFESEWPSEYGWIRFSICRQANVLDCEPTRTIHVRLKQNDRMPSLSA